MSNNLVLGILLLCYLGVSGQFRSFDKKIPLTGIHQKWHSIPLSDPVFATVNNNFSDIRIYGITDKDTVEVPYFLKVSATKDATKKIDFKRINTSSNPQGHYFTFEALGAGSINEIQLRFKNKNFDWRVRLEGSQNQKDWFTLLEEYRILSIQNDRTSYAFAELNFPKANYQFYRLFIPSIVSPNLQGAKLLMDSIIPADYISYPVSDFGIVENKILKQTQIDIDLRKRIPISFLQLYVADAIDFYRPVTISRVLDSVQTPKGLKYSYDQLFSGTWTSLEQKGFQFKSILAQKIRIVIDNQDNEPLLISTIQAKGFKHSLVARFVAPAHYYMVFGKAGARTPRYDIVNTTAKLPEKITALDLGSVEDIPKIAPIADVPLFENEQWLWIIMGVVLLVLAVFTVQMILTKK